jgi:hypothetical protein
MPELFNMPCNKTLLREFIASVTLLWNSLFKRNSLEKGLKESMHYREESRENASKVSKGRRKYRRLKNNTLPDLVEPCCQCLEKNRGLLQQHRICVELHYHNIPSAMLNSTTTPVP